MVHKHATEVYYENIPFEFLELYVRVSQSVSELRSRGIALKPNRPDGVLQSSAEVTLYVSVKNVTDHEVGIVRSPGRIPKEELRYHVDIRDSEGRRPPETSY